uniref:Reverse transcriptase domain-containing protein n=1 Tax=Hordeum vulgare subsp. vulgare TaxID=112509 RepID=A0A8I6X990_HORVV
MPMFHEFFIGTLDMGRINFGTIGLIPKVVGASDIRQSRPITVINVLARIFAKVCATRLSPVAEWIAHPLQSAFLKGRRIHDGILPLHEIVHEVASKGLKGVFLKLDIQKAYDRLDWSFLRLVMQRCVFDKRWCSWIMQLVRSGNMTININGEVGPFFQASMGVKQGDPISPLLFNFPVDALAGILDKAKLASHIQGVVGNLIPGGGVSHLQNADDTMIMVAGSDSDIVNLKFLLLCFEEISGLNINFDKSEVVVLGYSEAEQHRITDSLNSRLAGFPISYLGMPLAESRILVSGFDPLVGRVASVRSPGAVRSLLRAARPSSLALTLRASPCI